MWFVPWHSIAPQSLTRCRIQPKPSPGLHITPKLDLASRSFAAWLQKVARLQRGDRVALAMPNLLQYPVALFGALRAGLVVVNTNPQYTPR